MSRTTKRKYVAKDVLNTYKLPTSEQSIVKVFKSRGNNLHEVETGDGKKYLATMPTKFRKDIWIRKGCYVVVNHIKKGFKVRGEIVQILLEGQIKNYKEKGVWPQGFCNETSENVERKSSDSENNPANNDTEDCTESSSESEDNSAEDKDLFVNTNRPRYYSSSSDSEEE